MLLRLTLPHIHKQIDGAVVVRWHCVVGQELRFGSPIVDLEADRLRHLKVWQNASTISRAEVAAESASTDSLHRPASVGLTLVASESAFLREISVPEGVRAEIDEQLALVTTAPDEPLAPREGQPPLFRVVANYLDEGRRR